MMARPQSQAKVCIVDDDEAIREALKLLLFASDLNSCVYGSADDFLADPAAALPMQCNGDG